MNTIFDYLFNYDYDDDDFDNDRILKILNDITENRIDKISFRNINLQYAPKIADSLSKNNESSLRNLIVLYKKELLNHIKNKLTHVNTTRIYTPITNSLSSLFKKNLSTNNTLEDARKFLNKRAEANAFLHLTNAASQNDSLIMSMFDLYNIERWSDDLYEAKQTLWGLLEPFAPLVEEYRSIAKDQSNHVLKVIRTLMPLLVIAAVVVFISSCLSPLALGEIAALVILIPTLYLGFALAAQYVLFKDFVYKTAREVIYGRYKTPDFQVNQRIIQGFNQDTDLAQKVCDYYIKEIKACDATEARHADSNLIGLMTEDEITNRKTNLQRRLVLQFEWYDIHSNKKIGVDTIRSIVNSRLEEDKQIKHTQQNKEFSLSDETLLFELVNTLTDEIINELTLVNRSGPKMKSLVADLGLFSPKSLFYKQSVEKIDELIKLSCEK